MKARIRVTESEVRYWISQLLSSLAYLHEHNICHRDLKLDNIFLHERQVKLGDFGFSVRLNGNIKTKTFCGTPNYIAPEVVKRTEYSFPVDVWAIGVLVYTMTYGTPPFETSSAQTTYEKIKTIDYSFPDMDHASEEVKDVIRMCLQGNPDARPTCSMLLNHPFFAPHLIPASLPPNALGCQTTAVGASKKRARAAETVQLDAIGAVPVAKRMVLAEQNKENTSNMLRKQPAATAQNGSSRIAAQASTLAGAATPTGGASTTLSSTRTKLSAPTTTTASPRLSSAPTTRSAASHAGHTHATPTSAPMNLALASSNSAGNVGASAASRTSTTQVISSAWDQELHEAHLTRITERLNEIAAQPAIDKVPAIARPSISPAEAHRLGHHWIVTWLDYSQRFGLSFQFCDGTVGVLFIDSSSLMTYPAAGRLQYTKMVRDAARRVVPVSPTSPAPGSKGPIAKTVLEEFSLPEHREAIASREHMRNRVELLDYFSEYMKTKLAPSSGLAITCDPQCASHAISEAQPDGNQRLLGLLRWFKTETAIVFLFTNYTVQINFYDHVKLVITLPDLVANPEATELITVVSERGVGITRTPAQMMAGGVLTSSLISKLQFAAKVISSPVLHTL